ASMKSAYASGTLGGEVECVTPGEGGAERKQGRTSSHGSSARRGSSHANHSRPPSAYQSAKLTSVRSRRRPRSRSAAKVSSTARLSPLGNPSKTPTRSSMVAVTSFGPAPTRSLLGCNRGGNQYPLGRSAVCPEPRTGTRQGGYQVTA